ncbi:hypothetical protein MMC26_004042 [Xylographa opegraphella]|nr:hypothetical protein [Xylographa opegraphella]
MAPPLRAMYSVSYRTASRALIPQLALHLRCISSIPIARASPPRAWSPRFYSSNPGMLYPLSCCYNARYNDPYFQTTYRLLVYSSPTEPTPAPRFLLLRALSLTALGLVLTTSTFLLSASPALPSLLALATPPSPATTLTLYTPPDALAASIDHHITTHPLAVSLRQNPAFTESRPHVRIPAAMRAHNLTGGTLLGPGRIAVPPLAFIEDGGKSLVCVFYLGADLGGAPPGDAVHGGLLATILDEGMARCCFPALPNQVGMTANLTLNYRRPCPSEGYVVLRAWTRQVEGRKAWVEGRVESLVEGEAEPVVYVDAEALFIEPRQAKTMSRLYPAATA